MMRSDRKTVDVPTLAVILGMIGGTVGAMVWHQMGALSTLSSFLIGLFCMNLSFTAWHESSHGNFSSNRVLNTVSGWIASFGSVYPGYFARRREHLAHHKWQGIPKMDPVYPRVQTDFWGFPANLFRMALQRIPLAAPDGFLPITSSQRWSDRISNGLVGVLCLVAWQFDFFASLFWCWIAPRLAIFWVHAFYICFLPHSTKGGGYEVFRIRKSRVLNFLTLGQGLHGIHHKWPSIVWYEYARYIDTFEKEASQWRESF